MNTGRSNCALFNYKKMENTVIANIRTKHKIKVLSTAIPDIHRQPQRMATLGEMLKTWDHFNIELYQRLISIRYHNS